MFAKAREVFKRIRATYKEESSAQPTAEFEAALRKLVETYDTAIFENRFIVGGATEVLLCAWLRALGLRCEVQSGAHMRTDLKIEDVPFSVKTNFARSSSIRLVNVLGDSPEADWREPLLVLLAKDGLFYIDPNLAAPGDLRRRADVLELRTAAVRRLKGSEWHLPIRVPRKPKEDQETPSRVASHAVAREVLESIASQILLSQL